MDTENIQWDNPPVTATSAASPTGIVRGNLASPQQEGDISCEQRCAYVVFSQT